MPSVTTEGRAGNDRAKEPGKQWQPQRFRADVEDGVAIGYKRFQKPWLGVYIPRNNPSEVGRNNCKSRRAFVY